MYPTSHHDYQQALKAAERYLREPTGYARWSEQQDPMAALGHVLHALVLRLDLFDQRLERIERLVSATRAEVVNTTNV